jgi:hypothetical protein
MISAIGRDGAATRTQSHTDTSFPRISRTPEANDYREPSSDSIFSIILSPAERFVSSARFFASAGASCYTFDFTFSRMIVPLRAIPFSSTVYSAKRTVAGNASSRDSYNSTWILAINASDLDCSTHRIGYNATEVM